MRSSHTASSRMSVVVVAHWAILCVLVTLPPVSAAEPAALDLRAAALLMSGQEGGALRPSVAVRRDERGESVIVGIRTKEDGDLIVPPATDQEVREETFEVFVYAVGADGGVLGQIGAAIDAVERGRLLVVRLPTPAATEVRVLVRGTDVGLARQPVPAKGEPWAWWPASGEGGAENVIVALEKPPPTDPEGFPAALPTPDRNVEVLQPEQVPDPEPWFDPEGRARVTVSSAPGRWVFDLVSSEDEREELDVTDAGVGPGDARFLVVQRVGGDRDAVGVVASFEGEDLRGWKVRGLDVSSAEASNRESVDASEAGEGGAERDRQSVRRLEQSWRRAVLDRARGGALDPLLDVEKRLLDVAGTRAVVEIGEDWSRSLGEDALLGLALIRLEALGAHTRRPGGYGVSTLAADAVLALADELGERGRGEVAALVATALASDRLARGSRRAAREGLERAVSWDDSPSRRTALGVMAEKTGQRRKAAEHLRHAVELKEGHPEAALRLALIELRDGDRELALRQLESLLPGRAGRSVPRWIQIVALQEWARGVDDPGRALVAVRRGLELAPEHPALRLELAWLLDRLGRRVDADRELETVLGLRPVDGKDDERARYNRWPRALLEGAKADLRPLRESALRALTASEDQEGQP